MHKITAILFLFLILPSNSQAEMLMVGPGATSCKVFTDEIQNDGSMKHVYLSWAQGYMSAINARNTTTNDDVDLSSSLPSSGQLQFLINYCERDPDKWFVFGVMELMSILAQT